MGEFREYIDKGIGALFAVGSLPVATGLGVVRGTRNVLNGEEFKEGFLEVADSIVEKAEELGEEKGVEIVGAAASVVGAVIGYKNSKPKIEK